MNESHKYGLGEADNQTTKSNDDSSHVSLRLSITKKIQHSTENTTHNTQQRKYNTVTSMALARPTIRQDIGYKIPNHGHMYRIA